MDFIVDHMDYSFMHLAQYPRHMPTGLSVQSIGRDPHKMQHMHHVFDTFNLSLLLSGGGAFRFRG